MRERSTWQTEKGETPRQAATQRRADIYTMNQEHPQPAATDYESGNPDTWAESWHDYGQVSEEYEGDHVKRNELNFGEFRDDTWKHKDSDNWHSGKGNYDNVKHGEGKFENQSGKSSGEAKTAAERKAIFAERVARAILRTADDKLVTETALDLMALPAKNLVSTLKRMDAVSPDALPEDAKYRRAYACTKLAARLLGDGVKESYVESLASTFMSLDDPTLKAILKTVAAAASRTAQEEEEEQQSKGKTSQQQEQEEEEQKGHTSQQQEQEEEQQQQKTSQQQEQEEEQEQKVSQQEQQQQQSQQQQGQQEQQSQEQQQAHGLSPEEMAMLDQMLHEEMGEHGMPGAPAPAAPGGDTLVELFEAAPAPAVPAAPMMASGKGLDISFDDGDEEMPATHTASTASSLDDLFADDPEVQAQRELQTASAAAASNFASRTASSKGAKKLGAVRPAKPAALEDKLSALWPRPGE